MPKPILILMLVLLLTLAACAPAPTAPAQIDPPFPASGVLDAAAHAYPFESGWVDGEKVSYFNFGANTRLDPTTPGSVHIEPGFVFATGVNPDGSPIKIEGQGAIFDVTVGDANYTDLWQIFLVTPGPAYAPDSLKSLSELEASGFAQQKTTMLVNCPIVPAGSSAGELELIAGRVRGELIHYFDLGVTSATPGKVYAFVTGFREDGSPRLVAGQHFIFSTTRGRPGYSDFWRVYWVTVDSGYKTDSIRSEADIPGDLVRSSTWVVNYPHWQP